jgi:hypothetical protein
MFSVASKVTQNDRIAGLDGSTVVTIGRGYLYGSGGQANTQDPQKRPASRGGKSEGLAIELPGRPASRSQVQTTIQLQKPCLQVVRLLRRDPDAERLKIHRLMHRVEAGHGRYR